ncbi:hypothetical protein FGO68_gene9200 [Halteria grandinella]|uniref:Uncharacterized protein n=1 Tax=Halteria grandinella TaxID=5974 RepID=A0A8J8P7T7_HALGN|nr:hypothetical protein FGO68_gene9200 [Halteria grandinella]
MKNEHLQSRRDQVGQGQRHLTGFALKEVSLQSMKDHSVRQYIIVGQQKQQKQQFLPTQSITRQPAEYSIAPSVCLQWKVKLHQTKGIKEVKL